MAEPDDDAAALGNDLKGHRGRLRKRLFDGGGDALLDHELIEYLLAIAIPRGDTKALAKALMREFGGIGGVLTADAEALGRVKGMGEISTAAIKIAHAAAIRLLQSQVSDRPVLANWQALLDYLRADMAHHAIERFRVLHLNKCKPVVYARPCRLDRMSVNARFQTFAREAYSLAVVTTHGQKDHVIAIRAFVP